MIPRITLSSILDHSNRVADLVVPGMKHAVTHEDSKLLTDIQNLLPFGNESRVSSVLYSVKYSPPVNHLVIAMTRLTMSSLASTYGLPVGTVASELCAITGFSSPIGDPLSKDEFGIFLMWLVSTTLNPLIEAGQDRKPTCHSTDDDVAGQPDYGDDDLTSTGRVDNGDDDLCFIREVD